MKDEEKTATAEPSRDKDAARDAMPAANGGKPENDSLKQRTWLAVLVAILSFFGATAGTLVSFKFEIAKWERETNYTARQNLLNKRVELLDRTVRIWNKRDVANLLEVNAKGTLEISDASIKYAISKKHDYDEAKVQASMDRVLTDRLQLAEFGAEYGSVMTLDAMYFGPKTRDAIRDIYNAEVKGRWWELDDKLTQALANAMFQELNSY